VKDHAFLLLWSNIAKEWRADCSCGAYFGFADRVVYLAAEFDNHLDAAHAQQAS
jgi:hypothetical protein